MQIWPHGSLLLQADDTSYLADSGAKYAQWLERAGFSHQLGRGASLSAALHREVGHNELYLVDGDPNQLSTKPALILKLTHYFGAEKGT